MREDSELIAQIPARGGSKRVPNKNVRPMNGRPMIAYAIEAALGASKIQRVIVNTDSEDIARIAASEGAEVHMRNPDLANDFATGDDFTYDFIKVFRPKVLVMVNPVCPLITSVQIDEALEAFFAAPHADTLITCSETQMQVAVDEKFINIDPDFPLRPSQENAKVQVLNWAVTAWETESYMDRYVSGGGAYIGKSRILHPIDSMNAVKVSEERDFLLAESLLKAIRSN